MKKITGTGYSLAPKDNTVCARSSEVVTRKMTKQEMIKYGVDPERFDWTRDK